MPYTVPLFSIEMFHKPPQFVCPDHHEIRIILPETVPCHSALPADTISAYSSTVRVTFS